MTNFSYNKCKYFVLNMTTSTMGKEGDYFFGGQAYMTSGIQESLTEIEIISIIADVRKVVYENLGLGCLQVYINGTGKKIFRGILKRFLPDKLMTLV